MSGFPSLQPAMTIRVNLDPAIQVGSAGRTTPLVVVPMVSGTVKSEPGFEPAIDAEIHGTGYDFIRMDGSGQHMRLDVRSLIKNKNGELIAMYYKGPVALSTAVQNALSGGPEAKTTEYGDSFVTFEFETGSKEFQDLESMAFGAAGHFIVENGGLIVEYKVSRIIKG